MSKHEDIMELLKSVPGVEEHLNSPQVQFGKQILIHRIEKRLTQEKILELCREEGIQMDENTLSKIEGGSKSIGINVYERILNVLKNK